MHLESRRWCVIFKTWNKNLLAFANKCWLNADKKLHPFAWARLVSRQFSYMFLYANCLRVRNPFTWKCNFCARSVLVHRRAANAISLFYCLQLWFSAACQYFKYCRTFSKEPWQNSHISKVEIQIFWITQML